MEFLAASAASFCAESRPLSSKVKRSLNESFTRAALALNSLFTAIGFRTSANKAAGVSCPPILEPRSGFGGPAGGVPPGPVVC